MITKYKFFESKTNKYAIIKFNNTFLPEIAEIIDIDIKDNFYVVEFKKFDYWDYGLSDIASFKGIDRNILSCAFIDNEIYKTSNNKRELQKELKLLIATNKYNL